jgi:hypothetical protein
MPFEFGEANMSEIANMIKGVHMLPGKLLKMDISFSKLSQLLKSHVTDLIAYSAVLVLLISGILFNQHSYSNPINESISHGGRSICINISVAGVTLATSMLINKFIGSYVDVTVNLLPRISFLASSRFLLFHIIPGRWHWRFSIIFYKKLVS